MSKTNEEIVEELKPKVTLRSEDGVQWDKASHILQSALDAWYKDFEPALRTTLKAKDKDCEERVREEREAIVREVGLLLEAENDCQHTPSDSCDTTCMHQESTRVWNSAIREVRKVIEERQQALTRGNQ